jgi:glycerophosphoryl diester phosphodiesterase
MLVALNWLGLGSLLSPSYQALQIPEQHSGLRIASAALLQTAQARGLNVQLWTINEQPAMRRLLDLGAQGLITDYPDRALQLLGRSTRISALSD